MTIASFWIILAAATANVIIGYVWYHPRVFGTLWMRLAEVTPEMAEKGKRRMPVYILLSLCAGFGAAWIMHYFAGALGVVDGRAAILALALPAWLGFVVPTSLGTVLWEHRPLRLYLINAFYWLVTFSAMAVILLI